MTPSIAQVSSRNKLQPKRPSMLDALGEFRVPLEASIYWLGALAHPWPHVKPHNAKVVMLIPGFMAGDMTLAPLANFCRWLGHRAVYAGILSNSECPRETMRKLNARLALAYEKFDQPIVIVGQSLGGVYAREIAREHPEMVERVISLGSPIRMPRRHANLAVRSGGQVDRRNSRKGRRMPQRVVSVRTDVERRISRRRSDHAYLLAHRRRRALGELRRSERRADSGKRRGDGQSRRDGSERRRVPRNRRSPRDAAPHAAARCRFSRRSRADLGQNDCMWGSSPHTPGRGDPCIQY